jgi:uncharacterized protein with GYD domain
MPKFLVQASYTPEGLRGLQKDKASGRLAAVKKAAKSVGGSVETFYYAFGKDDVIAILDLPDPVSAATLALAISATGLVKIRTTPLLTIAEVDQALEKSAAYRAPGS